MTKFWSQMSLPARKICRRMAGRAVPVAALIAVSVLAISCSSAKQPPAAQPSGTTPSQSASTGTAPPTQSPTGVTPPAQTTPTGTPQCATSDLKVWLERDRGGGTAGTSYYLIEYKNVSDHTCQLRGYPGVSAYANGHQIGSSARWDGPISVSTVTLKSGATVHSVLGIANAGNYPMGSCQPVTATSLKVYPPNQTSATYIQYRFNSCARTGVRVLVAWPVQEGMGNPEGQTVLSTNVALRWQWPNAHGSPYRVKHSYAVPPLPVLRAISVGRHEQASPSYDRISFTFTGTFPSYDLFYVPALTADPSGKPVSIEGDGVLRIRFIEADAHDASGRSAVLSAPPAHIGYTSIAGYAQAGDFEGVVTYGVGSFRSVANSNVQPKVRAVEVKKTDGLGGLLYIVAIDIQTTGLGNPAD
jgi:hypothetical protein